MRRASAFTDPLFTAGSLTGSNTRVHRIAVTPEATDTIILMSVPADFDSIVQRFWDRSQSYGVNAVLTDEAIVSCEALLGVTLPKGLLLLLKEQNGGEVNSQFTAFLTTEASGWAPDHVPVQNLMGIGPADGHMTLDDSPYLNNEWGQPEQLVLLTGEGHWWIALDYRDTESAEPAVVWFDNELGDDVRLANSFTEFICSLRPTPPNAD